MTVLTHHFYRPRHSHRQTIRHFPRVRMWAERTAEPATTEPGHHAQSRTIDSGPPGKRVHTSPIATFQRRANICFTGRLAKPNPQVVRTRDKLDVGVGKVLYQPLRKLRG